MAEKYDVEANIDDALMVKRVNQIRDLIFEKYPKEPADMWDVVIAGITLGYVYGHTDGERTDNGTGGMKHE